MVLYIATIYRSRCKGENAGSAVQVVQGNVMHDLSCYSMQDKINMANYAMSINPAAKTAASPSHPLI
jgi:hypothetical protein